jgi:hypothetical protein
MLTSPLNICSRIDDFNFKDGFSLYIVVKVFEWLKCVTININFFFFYHFIYLLIFIMIDFHFSRTVQLLQ